MIGRFRNIILLLALLPLSACASFSGMPRSVLPVATATAIPPELQPNQALKASHADPRAFRNRVIAVYVAAVDARYAEFRRLLAQEVRGGNLGLDVAALGFGGLGSLAKGSANELAALTTFITGSRSSLNKELYFEKTLPALVAMMDANRSKARTALLANLGRDIGDYPLELAYADLANYELAASIDGAVQQLTTEAARKAAEEQQKSDKEIYQSLVLSCDPDEATGVLWRSINQKAYTLAGWTSEAAPTGPFPGTAKPEQLAAAASAFTGTTQPLATSQEQANAQAAAINRAARNACKIETLNALRESANSSAGGQVL